jgi:hypothetical protein
MRCLAQYAFMKWNAFRSRVPAIDDSLDKNPTSKKNNEPRNG